MSATLLTFSLAQWREAALRLDGDKSPPMALRNSVKATLLMEPEQPRSRSGEPGLIPDKPTSVAAPASLAPPRPAAETFLAATWHQRAEELCALADTLPSKVAWSQISKIASLYDELARDAGWTEEAEEAAAFSRDGLRLEEPQAAANTTRAEEPPPREPRAPERFAFPRRPLPSARPVPRRRA